MRDVIFVLSLIAAFVGPIVFPETHNIAFVTGLVGMTYWAYRCCGIRVRLPKFVPVVIQVWRNI